MRLRPTPPVAVDALAPGSGAGGPGAQAALRPLLAGRKAGDCARVAAPGPPRAAESAVPGRPGDCACERERAAAAASVLEAAAAATAAAAA